MADITKREIFNSEIERAFVTRWAQLGDGSVLVPEVVFAPPRKWRFDFYHEASAVAVELEGGVWSGGRHVRGAGFEGDAEKYNVAAFMGILVFRVTAKMLEDDPARWCSMIASTIAWRCAEQIRRPAERRQAQARMVVP